MQVQHTMEHIGEDEVHTFTGTRNNGTKVEERVFTPEEAVSVLTSKVSGFGFTRAGAESVLAFNAKPIVGKNQDDVDA